MPVQETAYAQPATLRGGAAAPDVAKGDTPVRTVWGIAVVVHGLAGAAWFGAMFYSLTVFQPRAKTHLKNDDAFEALIAAVSKGARWTVLSAFGLVGASGIVLAWCRWSARPPGSWWLGLLAAKCGLYLAALAVFAHASWRLWPRRIFAVGDEIPRIQKQFLLVGATMLLLIGGNMVLGLVANALALP